MSYAIGGLASQALPAIVGGAATYFATKDMAKSMPVPQIPRMPDIKLPDPPSITIEQPTEPGNAPLSASMTAAVQRYRRLPRGGAGAPANLTLTTPERRDQPNPGLIARATLLGR